MHQIKIEPDDKTIRKIQEVSRINSWSLKKTVEKIVTASFRGKPVKNVAEWARENSQEDNNGYIHQNNNKTK